MKVIFLGTNGWYTTPTGNTPCVLINSKDHYVIFDAGNAFYKVDQYIKEEKPISLFISHFHIDHISGFHNLIKFNFPQGLDIYVAQGRKQDFETFSAPPYTVGIRKSKVNVYNLPTKVRLHELEDGDHDVGFPLQVKELYHAYRDHGFRIELEGKTIAYSGDTKVGPNSLTLFQNVDVLIHECSWIQAPAEDIWGHVDPVIAAKLAKDAGVKQLVLTHFESKAYDTLEKRKEAEEKAKKIFPNTIAAYDDLVLEV